MIGYYYCFFLNPKAMDLQALCNAYCGEKYGSTDFSALENVRDAILRMAYYWYDLIVNS